MEKQIIPRKSYIKQIEAFVNQNVIKVLMGQRRVGKSYILLQLMEDIKAKYHPANIIFIDKELHKFATIKNDSDLYSYVVMHLKDGNNFLFIDEIQEITSFEKCLRSLLNEGKCDIYCTGSNAQLLSGELATMLAGRYAAFEIHSLSYLEFLEFNHIENSNDAINQYLTIGGMPFLPNFGSDKNASFEYLKNVYSSILLKDVVARQNIRNVALLESLVAYLVDNVGNILSAFNISKYLKSQQIILTPQTIISYLHALCSAFFVYRTPRADVNGLKIFETGEKYYFEDIGLRNAIRSFNFRNDVNKLMENAVFMQLKRCGYAVYVGKNADREVDFVAEKNGERLYIQVAYMLYDENVMQREFGNLLEIKNNFPKMVVTMDEIPVGSYKGIRQVHLREFLSNADYTSRGVIL
ncbi:MAG: ATP-binding protein [Prevotellaceae bacterium]|jgi:predicted AAA+ superfamily ATPase|nr:ATP-binding protein [Prevotellaceae bacterium]